LSSPKETSTEAEESTSKDVKASNTVVDRENKGHSIDAVSKSTQGESKLDTKLVDKSTTEEGEYGKGGI